MNCLICNERFDSTNHIPMVGKCGHSVCSGCTLRTTCFDGSCPICRQRSAFCPAGCSSHVPLNCLTSVKRNYQMIAMIEGLESDQKQQKLQKKQGLVPSSELSSMMFRKCTSCSTVVQENKLRVCVPCLKEAGQLFFGCLTDDTDVLCGSCFLEGPHKGHESELWLPRKLNADSLLCFSGLQMDNDDLRRCTKEAFEGLTTTMLLSSGLMFDRLCEKAKRCGSVAKFTEFTEKCSKEMEVMREVNNSVTTHLAEQTKKAERVKRALEELLSSDSDE